MELFERAGRICKVKIVKEMSNFISQLSDRAARAIRCWWLFLLCGLLCIAAGFAVFCNPLESYMTLSLLFGVVMLVTGIVELTVAASSRNYFMMRGYNIVGGILDVIVGILLSAMPSVTAALLPVFLGIWIMYHSFMLIGLAGDLSSFNVPGAGWGVAGGVLLLILSVLIIFKPFFGAAVVVILTGVALVVIGAIMIAGSLRLRRLHKCIQENFGPINLGD